MKDHEQINEKEVVKLTYAEQIKHPKWQKKRLQIFNRDGFKCQLCYEDEKQLHVHHKKYRFNKMIWEYDDCDLITLCSDCHSKLHQKSNKTDYVDVFFDKESVNEFGERKARMLINFLKSLDFSGELEIKDKKIPFIDE